MSDHPTGDPERMSPPEPDIDPAHARIQALLAEQGSTAPGASAAMPPEVVARLDDTLALLAAERAQDVVPLAPRRSRRWAPRGLVAAAAVVVIGLGGAAVGGLGGFPGLGSGADEGAATSDTAGRSIPEVENAPEGDAGAATAPEDGLGATGLDAAGRGLPALTSTTFARDARMLVAAGVLGPMTGDGASPRRSGGDDPTASSRPEGSPDASPSASPSESAGESAGESPGESAGGSPESAPPQIACAGPDLGREAERASVTSALLDGSLVALVVRPVGDPGRDDAADRSRLRVEAWSCDGETRLAAARIAP